MSVAPAQENGGESDEVLVCSDSDDDDANTRRARSEAALRHGMKPAQGQDDGTEAHGEQPRPTAMQGSPRSPLAGKTAID